MTPRRIFGLIVAMVTPMRGDESLDIPAVRPLVEKLIAQGADGLFVSGTAGESWALTPDEKLQLFTASVEAAAGRVPIIAGTGATTTREAALLTKYAEQAGCDAVSIVTPYYIRPTQEELYAHFMRVAEASSLPSMVYNIPKFTGVNVDVATMARLMKAGYLGAKDSSGDKATLMGYIECAAPENCILVGSDPLILEGLLAGAKGCISAPANAGVPILRRVFDAIKNGDSAAASLAQDDWNRAIEALRAGATFPATVKAATHALVSPAGACRLPIAPPSEASVSEAVNLIKSLI